jgi:hypothetical protein
MRCIHTHELAVPRRSFGFDIAADIACWEIQGAKTGNGKVGKVLTNTTLDAKHFFYRRG